LDVLRVAGDEDATTAGGDDRTCPELTDALVTKFGGLFDVECLAASSDGKRSPTHSGVPPVAWTS
jgi:hypothetical protein